MKFNARIAGLWVAGCAAIVLGAGCTSVSTEQVHPVGPVDEQVEIVLNAGIPFAVASDASQSGAAAPETRAIVNAEHEALPISILRLDATDDNTPTPSYPDYKTGTVLSATLAAATSGSPTSAITFTTTQYYQANGCKTKLLGWHPQTDDSKVTFSSADGSVSFTIDGESDVMLSNEQEGSKTNGDRFGGNMVTPDETDPDTATDASKVLKFEHQLTQIKVSAYAFDAAAQTAWGQLYSITLKDQGGKTCKVTFPNTDGSNVTFSSSTPSSNLDLVKKNPAENDAVIKGADATNEYDEDNGLTIPVGTDSTNATPCGYAMFQPMNDSGDKLTLLVTTANVTDWPVDIALPTNTSGGNGFLKGTAYTIVLKFTAKDIHPSGQITDWVEHDWPSGEGQFNGEVEL